MSDIIRMEKVLRGKNENHLVFKGFIPRKDSNFLYKFDFTGTEVSVSTYLPEKAKEQLRKLLIKDFGYAPYKMEVVKKEFGNGKDYTVDSVVGV